MNTILHIIRKEFIQLFRDKKLLPILFLPPLIQLVILCYAANLDVRNISAVIYDMDRTSVSRKFVEKFSNSGYFDIIGYVDSFSKVDYYIDHGKAVIAIVIPKKFSNRIKSNITVSVQIISDGAESNTSVIGLNYSANIISRYSKNIIIKKNTSIKNFGRKMVPVSPEMRVWYNPELKSRNFLAPGILALLLMVMTINLTSLAIVKEKELGTLEQIIVTPIKSYQLIIGKLIPFTIIGLINIVIVLLAITFILNIPVKGSVILLYFLCIIFLLSMLGLGLFVSTVSKTQQQAMMTSVFFIIMPMMFLSGFIFPIENMPSVIQFITYFLPLRYFFVIIRGIFLKGIGIAELWDETIMLIIFAVVILFLSIIRFHKKLE